MDVEEMVRFFAWIEDTCGPEELMDLADADVDDVQSLIDNFRGKGNFGERHDRAQLVTPGSVWLVRVTEELCFTAKVISWEAGRVEFCFVEPREEGTRTLTLNKFLYAYVHESETNYFKGKEGK